MTSLAVQSTPSPFPLHVAVPPPKEHRLADSKPVRGLDSMFSPSRRRSHTPAMPASWIPGTYWDTCMSPDLILATLPFALIVMSRSPEVM